MNIFILLLVNYIVGGYAVYRIFRDTNRSFKVNGFGLYIFKYTGKTLIKWSIIVSLLTMPLQFLLGYFKV